MNPIIRGIEAGYSPEDMLEYISKSLPSLVPKITKAMSKGYGIKEILGFLAQSTPQSSQSTKGLSEIEIQNRSQQQQGQLVKNGLIAAGTAIAAPLGMNMARSALSRALPRSLANGALSSHPTNIPSIPNAGNLSNTALEPTLQSPQAQTNQSSLTQQPPANPVATNILQPPDIQQPKGNSDKLWTSILNGKLTDRDPSVSAFMKVANNLRKTSGLTSKEQFDKLHQAFESKRQMGLEGPELARELFAEWEQMKSPTNQQPESNEMVEKPKSIEKNATVASPNGVGEVKEIRNGKALIDVDGKLHKVNEDELEVSPLPEKDLSDLYDELISGIESETGEDVSRMVQWAGYNPETNTLQFLPHTGKLYKYGDISPEDAALLTDILSVRKTSGENFIGAWKAGSKSPIGAALSKLIRKLQSERGGKGNEYEETHEPIYSAYEPAIQAKKKKKKK